ncbi:MULTISPECIES: hypothetical protein [Calothrix]|uniref:Uncharacterized protein n=2 Tax=Calothrix TaxID=1186 RepID=A0ABR8AEK9_9CYAN|nr:MULTISPECIES: hypothetical protein [Calothrix]MBD2197940.1 hypothetical protein [Calothrix parietina FACHB-288]MBD2226775.1 hypothetical protein [Calothrix anomala FACHB-343]
MAEPTLTDVFGANATQTSTTITITKADLPGLTAGSNNTAESLLIAILLKAQTPLSQTNFESNLDQSIYIANGFPSFAFRGTNNDQYRVDQLTINAAKPDTTSTIDPDDY